jgi:hypothetical protein
VLIQRDYPIGGFDTSNFLQYQPRPVRSSGVSCKKQLELTFCLQYNIHPWPCTFSLQAFFCSPPPPTELHSFGLQGMVNKLLTIVVYRGLDFSVVTRVPKAQFSTNYPLWRIGIFHPKPYDHAICLQFTQRGINWVVRIGLRTSGFLIS